MSEMNDIISKKMFLDVCIGIEGLCADLYHYYSEIYGDIPEASSLWKKTALEEENHQKQFQLALRLLNETEFDVLKDAMQQAYAIQYKLMTLMNNVKHTKPDLLIAVSKAVEMEEKLANLHAHASLKFKEESMQKLFKTLSEADRDHVANLKRYRSILYLPLSEMQE
jgi:rubrerythrin